MFSKSIIFMDRKITKYYERKKFSYGLVISYMLFIFYLSSIPLKFPEVIDKLDPTKFSFHVAEYMILSFLFFNATKKSKLSFFISGSYGISDEIHQYFVPFRVFSLEDVAADWIGSFIGVLIAKKVLKH